MTTPLKVTRIGHSCHVIEIGGTRMLTDPWFTTTATYYQGEPVAATVVTLGRIDAIVISHEHYDPGHHVLANQLRNFAHGDAANGGLSSVGNPKPSH